VDLTEGKADEYGRAVHESCNVSMLVSKKPRWFTERIGALRERLSLLSHQWASQQVWSVVLAQHRELQDSEIPPMTSADGLPKSRLKRKASLRDDSLTDESRL
jgi:hypothetical protein